MDFNDIIPTIKYAASTSPRTLLEQLRAELEDTYTKNSALSSEATKAEPDKLRMDSISEFVPSVKSEAPKIKTISVDQRPGVIVTPEAIEELENKRNAIEKKIQELKSMRKIDELEVKQQARQARVRDTLEKTGLLP